MRILYSTLFFIFLLQSNLLASIEVTARFNPPRIALGDQAQYIVEVRESGLNGRTQVEPITALPIPKIDKLQLRNGRTSSGQRTSFVNGSVQHTVTQSLIIDAIPSTTGVLTIPDYNFEYKNKILKVPGATLQVVERPADATPTRDELIFLKAEVPEQLYVGQSATFALKLYVSEHVRLRGLHSFDRSADGFTLSELPKENQESSEIVNGRRYSVITWPLMLTPIQTGTQEISFQFGLSAQLPSRDNSRDPFGRSPFGGNLFDDFFGRSERLNVFTETNQIEVLPLPEPQPNSFSGAIGDFAMEVSSDAEETVQGEPIMLSLVLKGEGNFDRIDGPVFAESPDWKFFAPEIKFESSDPQGMRGSQRYDYVFIPQRAGQLELPETRFSYFDPEKKEYLELSAPAIPVKVAPGQNTFRTPPEMALPPSAEKDLELTRTLTAEEALLTLDYRPKKAPTIGSTILTQPFYISLNGAALFGLLVSAILLIRFRKNREDPIYPLLKTARESLKQETEKYKTALSKNDSTAFYKSAQAAIRHAATIKYRQNLQNANSIVISQLLPDEAAEAINAFFAAADAHRFGRSNDAKVNEARQQLEIILKSL